MPDLRAPDFTSQPINTQTIQYLTVPAYAAGYLTARSSAAWEQAAVLYFDWNRSGQLLGNYHHPGMHGVGAKPHSQLIAVAGWHKRSGPDGGQPWHASRGQVSGRVCRWDDSHGNLNYTDLVVELTLFPGPRTQGESGSTGTTSSPLVVASDAAKALSALAAIEAVGRTHLRGEAQVELLRYTDDAIRRITEQYLEAHSEVPGWPPPVTADVILASELELAAQALHEGSIRKRLETLQAVVLEKRMPPSA